MSWHVLRSWNPPDPFAPECGCEIPPLRVRHPSGGVRSARPHGSPDDPQRPRSGGQVGSAAITHEPSHRFAYRAFPECAQGGGNAMWFGDVAGRKSVSSTSRPASSGSVMFEPDPGGESPSWPGSVVAERWRSGTSSSDPTTTSPPAKPPACHDRPDQDEARVATTANGVYRTRVHIGVGHRHRCDAMKGRRPRPR